MFSNPEQPDDRYFVLLRDIAESLRIIAHREPSESRESKAVRLLMELGPDNIAAIARAVGVNRGTLYRWPTFKQAMERVRAVQAFQYREPRSTDEL